MNGNYISKKSIIIAALVLTAGLYLVSAQYFKWWPFGKFPWRGSRGDRVCIQVITKARNIKTEEIKFFPTPCDMPKGWELIN